MCKYLAHLQVQHFIKKQKQQHLHAKVLWDRLFSISLYFKKAFYQQPVTSPYSCLLLNFTSSQCSCTFLTSFLLSHNAGLTMKPCAVTAHQIIHGFIHFYQAWHQWVHCQTSWHCEYNGVYLFGLCKIICCTSALSIQQVICAPACNINTKKKKTRKIRTKIKAVTFRIQKSNLDSAWVSKLTDV